MRQEIDNANRLLASADETVKITACYFQPDGNGRIQKLACRDGEEYIKALNAQKICADEKFRTLVNYRDVDMNHVPDDLNNYDFTWSSCSLEHLGSLRHGEDFIFNRLKCLKPGGIAVHTTEYTFTKNYTVKEGSTVFYRKKDILSMAERLLAEGHDIQLNLYKGNRFLDWYNDIPPHRDKNHVKLLVSKQSKFIITTSIGLLIKKNREAQYSV